jgi:hypothetical protein
MFFYFQLQVVAMPYSRPVASIIKHIQALYNSLPTDKKDLGVDYLVKAKNAFLSADYRQAYYTIRSFYRICNLDIKNADALFSSLWDAEDVVTADATVVIHEDSPYYKSIKALAKQLNFDVQAHNLPYGMWTKDYIVSTGEQVMIPVVEHSHDYLTPSVLTQARRNPNLYYGSLQMEEHHKSKKNITSPAKWLKDSSDLFTGTQWVRKAIIEGGNFFCAINNEGQRYYLVGENVISESMAFHQVTRNKIIKGIAKELGCEPKFILAIPQWTYHLDLQMAYLGNGQFVIHSFDQKSYNFGLDQPTTHKLEKTFIALKQKFEHAIIDKLCLILTQHGFTAQKVFGCLFYLDDCTDKEQLKYVPNCKSTDGFDGVLALMMNGIALNLGVTRGRHFIMPRCDVPAFRAQFEQSLQALGIKAIHDADILEAYADGDFNGLVVGILGATNVAQTAACMNGSIRCQTSIVNKWHLISEEHDLGLIDHRPPSIHSTSLPFFAHPKESTAIQTSEKDLEELGKFSTVVAL